MKRDIGEELLRTWLELAAAIWSRQMVSGMTYNEAVVSNLLLHQQQESPETPLTATELCEKTNIRKSQMNLLLGSLEKQGYLRRCRSEKVYVLSKDEATQKYRFELVEMDEKTNF